MNLNSLKSWGDLFDVWNIFASTISKTLHEPKKKLMTKTDMSDEIV